MMKEEKIELNPCKCGLEPVVRQIKPTLRWSVECAQCQSGVGDYVSREKAVMEWNIYNPPDQSQNNPPTPEPTEAEVEKLAERVFNHAMERANGFRRDITWGSLRPQEIVEWLWIARFILTREATDQATIASLRDEVRCANLGIARLKREIAIIKPNLINANRGNERLSATIASQAARLKQIDSYLLTTKSIRDEMRDALTLARADIKRKDTALLLVRSRIQDNDNVHLPYTLKEVNDVLSPAQQVEGGKEVCGECGGKGGVDSGGSTPWGSAISVPCPTCGGQPHPAPAEEVNSTWSMVIDQLVNGVKAEFERQLSTQAARIAELERGISIKNQGLTEIEKERNTLRAQLDGVVTAAKKYLDRPEHIPDGQGPCPACLVEADLMHALSTIKPEVQP